MLRSGEGANGRSALNYLLKIVTPIVMSVFYYYFGLLVSTYIYLALVEPPTLLLGIKPT